MNYEAALNGVEGLRFLPWIGESYGTGSRFGLGVLVLGEAHYGPEHDYTKALTRELTEEFVRGCWRHRFWTGIGQVLMGRAHWEYERGDVWTHVAFYNYVQWFASDGPREAPQETLWNQSEQPFRSLLLILKPRLVLVLGERLWSWLPSEHEPGPRIQIPGEADSRETRLYTTGLGMYCLAGRIRHPSAAFSWSRWHPWVEAYLREAISLEQTHGQ